MSGAIEPPTHHELKDWQTGASMYGLTTRATRRHRAASQRWIPAPMISQMRFRHGP